MRGWAMEPDAEQGCRPMGRLGIRVSYLAWFLFLIFIYMAIVSPSTIGALASFIDHVFIAIANGFTHFLDSALKVH
jgi:hypothetical protein